MKYVADSILRPAGIKKILLVTSNFHTHRAAHFMRAEAPWLQVAVVPAPDNFFSPHRWWKTRRGVLTFFMEWVKTVTEWWTV